MEVAAKSSRTATTPSTSLEIYPMNREGNSRKYARNAALTRDGMNNLNQNLKFGSYITRGKKIFAPSKISRQISEKVNDWSNYEHEESEEEVKTGTTLHLPAV